MDASNLKDRHLSKLSEAQMHQIVSRNLQASNPEEWERILLQAVYPDKGTLLTIRLADGTAITRARDPLSTARDLRSAVPLQGGIVKFVLAGEVLRPETLVAMLPAEISAVVVAVPRWYQAPLNCEILNDGFTVECSTGTTGQWEAIYGHHETDGDLEFAVSLDVLNGAGSVNNVCIGVAPADFKPSTAGGMLNANAATVAFGTQGFPMSQQFFQVNDGKRWKQGDVVQVTSDADTGDVKFFWDGEVRAELKAMALQRPVRPVVFMWYQGDKVSFVAP